MDPLSESMNKSLVLFTDSLIPMDEFLAAGTKQVQEVMRTLTANSKFSIARYRYAGSVGKHTEIMCPDYDVVVFLNDVLPPFDKVLEDFKDVLTLEEKWLGIDTLTFEESDIGLQFQFKESLVEMDLVIGVNCLKEVGGGDAVGGRALVEKQREGVLPLLEADATNFLLYSGSLAELQTEFVKQRSGFTHQVIRLGKFWFKTLYLGVKQIYGIKAVLEIIAVLVAEKEEKKEGKGRVLIRTFMKFLELVSKLDKLKIAYRYDPAEHRWELVPVQEREVGYRYDSSGFPPGTLTRENFILEPANPYNDLAKNFKKREVELENLKKFAKITLDRLERVVVDHQRTIYEVFRPLPTALKPTVFNMTPKFNWLVSSFTKAKSLFNPRMIVRREEIFKIPGMRNELRALQGFLYTAVHAAAASLEQKGEAVEAGSVKRAVQRMIDEDVRGVAHTSWNPLVGKQHEDYDVTFEIPLATKPEVGVFQTSFKWERN